MAVCDRVLSKFNTNSTAPHFVRNCYCRSRPEERIEDCIARMCGYFENALQQPLRFRSCERRNIWENRLGFCFRSSVASNVATGPNRLWRPHRCEIEKDPIVGRPAVSPTRPFDPIQFDARALLTPAPCAVRTILTSRENLCAIWSCQRIVQCRARSSRVALTSHSTERLQVVVAPILGYSVVVSTCFLWSREPVQ